MEKLELIGLPSATALTEALAARDISVAPRIAGRTTAQVEQWIACHLLGSISDAGVLNYPLSVVSRDRPDLEISMPGSSIGVEITEAIPEKYAAFSALAQREFPGSSYSLSAFRLVQSDGVDLESMREVLRNSDSTPWDGWAGDQPERQWAEGIAASILGKKRKMGAPGFQNFEENWLSIYDNLPLPNIDLPKGVGYLKNLLDREYGGAFPFDRVYIESGKTIVCLTAEDASYLPLRELW